MHSRCLAVTGALALALSLPAESEGDPIMFQASGANAAAIQATVDAFRAALGNPNNGNNPGPLGSGRREINWDGGGATTTSLAPASFDGFQNSRGALFTTDGTGFAQAVLTDTFPARISAMEAERFKDPVLQVFKQMLPYGRPVPAHPNWVQISQAYFDGIQRILLGDEDVQQAMDGAAAEIESLL